MSTINLTATIQNNKNFINYVSTKSGQPVQQCYQCGKCTAGCPIALDMDYAPNRIIRMIQLGLKDEVLNSQTIWLCAHCSTCTSRCPRNVNLAQVMDCLRNLAKRENIHLKDKAKDVALFYDCFLGTVKKNGKLHELGMMLNFNLKSGNFLKDADAGLAMFTKGKIKFMPSKNKNCQEVAQIFERVKELEARA